MGIVYLAHDVQLERPVAIKLLAPALAANRDMRRRFLREARIAAQCFHPHIVPIHAVEEVGDLAFFVMAYVQGETLAERLHRTGPLRHELIQRVGRDVGWALAYAHERGVVHRDVKPENILLEDGTERALIMDFGIAVRDDIEITPRPSEVSGTPRFMAPEQALGEPLDGRADLYALGVTLHLAATGRLPFDGRSALQQLIAGAPAPSRTVRATAPALPVSLADAIDKCLSRRAEDRFESAAAFVQAISDAGNAPPIPPMLRPAASSASGARAFVYWALVCMTTTVLLATGETHGSLGMAILWDFNLAFCGVLVFAGALLGGEALLRARRAISAGASPHDVVRSLGGALHTDPSPPRTVRHLGGLLAGAGFALLQGKLSRLHGMPELAESLLQTALVVAPPLLIGRSVQGLWRGSRAERWINAHVTTPLLTKVTRWIGRGVVHRADTRALPATAPTEVRLGNAADEILARLSPALQRELRAIPDAASALVREAEALRQRDAALAVEGRSLRSSAASDAITRLASVDAQRSQVQARLATTVAALETIRLDLLRLENGDGTTGDLTEHLEVAKDLQRRVDAVAEVRAMLRARAPELTPV